VVWCGDCIASTFIDMQSARGGGKMDGMGALLHINTKAIIACYAMLCTCMIANHSLIQFAIRLPPKRAAIRKP